MAKKWEYLVVDIGDFKRDDLEESELNSYGEKGWELVAVTETCTEENEYSQSGFYSKMAYFKREKAQ